MSLPPSPTTPPLRYSQVISRAWTLTWKGPAGTRRYGLWSVLILALIVLPLCVLAVVTLVSMAKGSLATPPVSPLAPFAGSFPAFSLLALFGILPADALFLLWLIGFNGGLAESFSARPPRMRRFFEDLGQKQSWQLVGVFLVLVLCFMFADQGLFWLMSQIWGPPFRAIPGRPPAPNWLHFFLDFLCVWILLYTLGVWTYYVIPLAARYRLGARQSLAKALGIYRKGRRRWFWFPLILILLSLGSLLPLYLLLGLLVLLAYWINLPLPSDLHPMIILIAAALMLCILVFYFLVFFLFYSFALLEASSAL